MRDQTEQLIKNQVKLTLIHDKDDSYAIYRIYDKDRLVANLIAARWQDEHSKAESKFYGEIIVDAVNTRSLTPPSEWIAIKSDDDLPDGHGRYLCTYTLGAMVDTDILQIYKKEWTDQMGELLEKNVKVIAYQKLPEPFRPAEKGE